MAIPFQGAYLSKEVYVDLKKKCTQSLHLKKKRNSHFIIDIFLYSCPLHLSLSSLYCNKLHYHHPKKDRCPVYRKTTRLASERVQGTPKGTSQRMIIIYSQTYSEEYIIYVYQHLPQYLSYSRCSINYQMAMFHGLHRPPKAIHAFCIRNS